MSHVYLERYTGSWAPDDPDANFKRDVAERTRIDPLPTIEQLAQATGIPVGALVRYVLARWASEGSDALLALGPATVERLWGHIAEAEEAGTDEARLAAYAALRTMISWLRVPLAQDAGGTSPGQQPGGQAAGSEPPTG